MIHTRTNVWICSLLVLLFVASCSDSGDAAIYSYISKSLSEPCELIELQPSHGPVEGWKYYATNNSSQCYLPSDAVVDENTLSIKDHNGFQIIVWKKESMAESPLRVFLDGLDKIDPASDVVRCTEDDSEEYRSVDYVKLNDAIHSLSGLTEREQFEALFTALVSNGKIEDRDKFQVFTFLVGNSYSSELGDKLWHLKSEGAECYAGVSLSNSSREQLVLYAWLLDATGRSRLHISLSVASKEFVQQDFERLHVKLASHVRFEGAEN